MSKVVLRAKNPFYVIMAATILVIAMWLLVGWVIMSALNIIHDDWLSVPALGFAASLQVVLLVYVGGVLWNLGSDKK